LFDTGTGQRRREWQILYNALANNFLYAFRNPGTTSGTDAKSTEISMNPLISKMQKVNEI
jgi:hypothetical protein